MLGHSLNSIKYIGKYTYNNDIGIQYIRTTGDIRTYIHNRHIITRNLSRSSCWSHDWLPRPLLTTVHFIIPFPAVHFTVTNPCGRNAEVRSWTESLALRIAPHFYTEREGNKISLDVISLQQNCHLWCHHHKHDIKTVEEGPSWSPLLKFKLIKFHTINIIQQWLSVISW